MALSKNLMDLISQDASEEEFTWTKNLLQQRRYMLGVIKDYEKHASDDLEEVSSESIDDIKKTRMVEVIHRQKAVYEQYSEFVRLLDRAIGLIDDEDCIRMIELRYIQGQSYVKVELYFSSKYTQRTVDRKLKKGIQAIAAQLKNWGLFNGLYDLIDQAKQ